MESTSSFNDDMPVEKILDAELAIEPKTDASYAEGGSGNSVSLDTSSCIVLSYLMAEDAKLR